MNGSKYHPLPDHIRCHHMTHGQIACVEPCTKFKLCLQQVLEESEACSQFQKSQMKTMQAHSILTGLYIEHAQTQLQGQEDKSARKKSTYILSNGLPCLLTNDEMFAAIC